MAALPAALRSAAPPGRLTTAGGPPPATAEQLEETAVADLPMHDRKDVVIPEPPGDLREALSRALSAEDHDARRRAVGEVAASDPTFLDAWAELAPLGREPIERYSYARVGYHRGLDTLRRHGWGGTGYVRWAHATNRGFLRCLVQLRRAAEEIGETPEVERIADFLRDLDPDWDDANA